LKIANYKSYSDREFIEKKKGQPEMRVNSIDCSVIDPPSTDENLFLTVVQMKDGKPSENLRRNVNEFIKSGKPLYVLYVEDDYLDHFDKFEPRISINYSEEIEKLDDKSYKPTEKTLNEFMKIVYDDLLHLRRLVKND